MEGRNLPGGADGSVGDNSEAADPPAIDDSLEGCAPQAEVQAGEADDDWVGRREPTYANTHGWLSTCAERAPHLLAILSCPEAPASVGGGCVTLRSVAYAAREVTGP